MDQLRFGHVQCPLSTNFIIDYLQEVANIAASEVLVKYMMVVLGLILF